MLILPQKIIENIGQIVEIITSDAEAIGGDDGTISYSTSDETDVCGGLEKVRRPVHYPVPFPMLTIRA